MTRSQRNKIDINCDMGEIDSLDDAAFMPFISSCNISCGAHAGAESKIIQTIQDAIRFGLRIGAHPSYPDKENFGRKSMLFSAKDFESIITDQLIYISSLMVNSGKELHHVKAHGALYNDLLINDKLLKLFFSTIFKFNPELKVLGFASKRILTLAKNEGLDYISEVFMDRRYSSSTQLMSRQKTGAVLTNVNLIKEQVDQLCNGFVLGSDGQKIILEWDSICLHSDTPNAVIVAQEIHSQLINKGYEIA